MLLGAFLLGEDDMAARMVALARTKQKRGGCVVLAGMGSDSMPRFFSAVLCAEDNRCSDLTKRLQCALDVRANLRAFGVIPPDDVLLQYVVKGGRGGVGPPHAPPPVPWRRPASSFLIFSSATQKHAALFSTPPATS